MESKQKSLEETNNLKPNNMEANFEIQKTLDFVNDFFGFDISDKTRKREVVEARMMYATLLKRYTRISLTEIGRPINKDHATVIHYIKNFDWLKKNDERFSRKFDMLRDMYDEFRSVWFDDEVYDDKRKIKFLENTLEILTLEKNKYETWVKKNSRLDSIIQLINERTPKGEEEYVEQKINRMFNSIVFK